ncbi:MAG: GTPase [Puia sp.]
MIEGIEFRLIDTAGIRAHTADQIEQLGIERTHEKIAQADIVLEILDATDPLFSEHSSEVNGNPLSDKKNRIRVLNKTDLFFRECFASACVR